MLATICTTSRDARDHQLKRPPLLMALEPRILYDGAGAVVAADGITEGTPSQASEPIETQGKAPEVSGQEQGAAPAEPSASDASSHPATDADPVADITSATDQQQIEQNTTGVQAVESDTAGQTAATSNSPDGIGETEATGTTQSTSEPVKTDAGSTSDASDTSQTDESASTAAPETSDHTATTETVETTDLAAAEAVGAALPTEGVREIVFVDSQVEDHETLVAGIVGLDGPPSDDAAWTVSGDRLIITLTDDPLAQIDQVLAQYHDLDAIHIVSHGDTGELVIGSERITDDTLAEYAGHIAAWGSALSADGDLLLYGCTVGADGRGQEFVDHVAALSGADVAASDDPTGNTAQGGDWDLEVVTGPIETSTVLNDSNAATWKGLLAPPVAHDDGPIPIGAGIPTSLDVLANDTDSDAADTLHITGILDMDIASFTANSGATPLAPGVPVTLQSGTTVTLIRDGSGAPDRLEVVMAPGSNDLETFFYVVSDNSGLTSRAMVTLARDSDLDGVANNIDLDDDNDGVLDLNEGKTTILQESFDTPQRPALGNNLLPTSLTDYNGLYNINSAGGSSQINIVRVDGSPYAGGPVNAQDGNQYFDINGTSTVYYTFTLAEGGLVDLSLWYSQRESTATIWDEYPVILNTETSEVLAEGNHIRFDNTQGYYNKDTWHVSQISSQWLPAGTYTLPFLLNNANIDNITITVSRDSDGDGCADHLDVDSDNDGITDNIEAQSTAGYKPPSGTDGDGDGLDDAYDADTTSADRLKASASAGLTPVDTDSDGQADIRDADADNDGALDIAERGDGQPTSITSSIDTDRDGLLDIFEKGTVNDGFTDDDINWADGAFTLADSDNDIPADGSGATPLIRDLDYRDANAPPVAIDDFAVTQEDRVLTSTVPLLANDTDADGDALTVVAGTFTTTAGGSISINSDGSYVYTPPPGFSGVDTVQYTVSDGISGSDIGTLAILVDPVISLLDVTPDVGTTPENTPYSSSIPLTANDTAAAGDTLTATPGRYTGSEGGILVIYADGSYTYTPPTDFTGVETIPYPITDSSGDSVLGSLTMTVTPVNAPPVAVDDMATTVAGHSITSTVSLIANDSDPDGDSLSVTPGTFPTTAGGSITINPDGSYVYTPPKGFSGIDTVPYTITDGNGGTATATLHLTVTPEAVPATPKAPQPVQPPLPVAPVDTHKSTGLLTLYPDAGVATMTASWNGSGKIQAELADNSGTLGALDQAESSATIRYLGLDGALDLDANSGDLIGTSISQYIHDTVNHAWERVERWYGMGTPASEMIRYDTLGGARDEFNASVGPAAVQQLERLSRQLDAVLNAPAEHGEQAASRSPILGAARSLQHQLNTADLYNKEALLRLAR